MGILKRDLLALVKNPIALLVVGALLVLPGLYAWYCIVANWDPYANTGNMPVAVVNQDKGAKSALTGEVNIGKLVVEQLEGNDSIDWRFYDDESQALEDTRKAVVYAALVLPEDLSSDVIGIFEGSKEKPTIYYYPNEKYNAVATKVTDSAAQTLVRQVNQGFSSTVNEKILESAQKLADEAEGKADQVNASAIAAVRDIQADLDNVIVSLDDAAGSIDGWRVAAVGAESALGATADQLPAIRSLLQQGSSQLDSLRASTGEFESSLSSTVLDSAATISRLSGEAAATLAQATQDLAVIEERMQALADASSGDVELREAVEVMQATASLVSALVDGVNERVGGLNATVQEMTGDVASATDQISGEVMPQLSTGAFELTASLSRFAGALQQFEPQIAQLREVLSQTDSALESATGAIADAKVLLSTISGNLKGTVSDIGAIGSALEIERLSDLLNVDPENVGTFVSSPVQMVTEKINPVSNYGTAVAPFYTNLALWIGCFILASLMKVEVDTRGFEESTSRQRYFGRWSLFVILSLIQSQVICGVDVLLGIDCQHPALFMLAGAICSFAYMNLIFALVKTFRNIGKTLCILLLIMQVPGSSGMYPIQMMPGFFQFIHPALPFTYGIDAMREALSGLYGTSYLLDVAFLLLIIVPGSLLIGLGLRPLMANLLVLFDDEMRKTGFFASEEYAKRESDRLRGAMRVLAAHDAYADDIEERAWRFNRAYPKLRKAGAVATFVVPFAFLVLMLPFNLMFDLSVDVKLTALVVMVVVLLLIQFGLIALEYTHHTIAEETRLLGASLLDEWDIDLSELAPAQEEAPAQGMVPAGTGERASRPKGGPAWDIFSTDMRLGLQSMVGVVVIILLVITPSMYAWFNIAGSWDPYSSTGNLKVAVANEDEGYKGDLIPVTINIGDTVVSQLRGNDSFDWVFVGKDQALDGVQSSEYYAAVEIPKDFSRNMMTYLIDDSDYPDVVYYTNEKENPIAPIITQKGADSIQENIRVSFTERVDEIALSVAYDVLNYVTNPHMSDYVAKMSKHLDDAVADARSSAREVHSLAGLSSTVASIVEAAGTAVEGLEAAGVSAKAAVGDARSGLANASTAFDRAVSVVRSMLSGRELDVDRVQSLVDGALALLEGGSEEVPELIDAAIQEVEGLRAAHPSEAAAQFDALIRSLQTAKQNADAVPGKVNAARSDAAGLIQDARAEIDESKAYFNDTVQPAIDELRSTLGAASESTSQVAGGLEDALSGFGDSTGGLSNQLGSLSDGLNKAGDQLELAATGIQETKARVAAALSSGNVKQIEAVILGGDPELMAENLAAPVQEQREAMFAVANYGSAMAPFYTVLSLWVGALVMISTMRVRVVDERIEELRQRYGRVRPRHEFFGRYGIFGFVGLLQSSLVLLGDLLLLRIQCVNPALFFFGGLFIGQAFCLLVYTLTELFGDVGKALCVILLIMQVAASGGTFPVQMLDPFLIDIVPFLPFYHAMCLLQEAVAGVDWLSVLANARTLLLFVAFALVVALPLRRPFRKLNVFFEEQLERTGYM